MKVSLEDEKETYNKLWDELLEKSLKEKKVDQFVCSFMMHNLDMMDLRLIENNRRDLLG